MALSKKELMRAVNSVPEGDDVGVWVVGVCRAVEAEVRKQDDALILMLVERLERADKISGHANNKAAIKAGRVRLEGKP